MSKVDVTYNFLLEEILKDGAKQEDRTGTGTLSIFGKMLKFDMSHGFPLLSTKKVWFHGVLHELLWFISGGTNIEYLVKNNVHIWDAWPYKRYSLYRKNLVNIYYKRPTEKGESEYYSDLSWMPRDTAMERLSYVPEYTEKEFIQKIRTDKLFARTWGKLGPVYGSQWRSWHVDNSEPPIDQLQKIQDTLRTNPDSRRMLVTALNVADLPDMALDPCHYSFQFHSEKMDNGKRKLSLIWNQRSVDVFLGLPFNIASYAALLHMMAHVTNHVPGNLIASLGNTHIYSNHINQVNEQLSRTVFFNKPKFIIKNPKIDSIFDFKYEDIEIKDYKYHPAIKAPIAV